MLLKKYVNPDLVTTDLVMNILNEERVRFLYMFLAIENDVS